MSLFADLSREPYEHRGILHSEIALIIYVARRLGIKRIVESGRARAQSTYLLAKYLPDVEIHSVELRETADEEFARKRLRGFENVTLLLGDIRGAVGSILRWDQPTAILCDGPKGAAAVGVIEQCFANPHILVGFIHDMRRLDHGGPSPHRAAAEAAFERKRFTDDPAYVAATSWMDAEVVKAGGPCGPQFEAEFGSYGPTLGAFFNKQTAHSERPR